MSKEPNSPPPKGVVKPKPPPAPPKLRGSCVAKKKRAVKPTKDKQSQDKAENKQPINHTMQSQIFEYATNVENIKLKATDIAKAVGLGERQVYRYLTNEFWEAVRDERRKRYAKHAVFVDEGLVRGAVKGNPRSAQLFYEKYENWVPTKKHEVTGRDGTPIEVTETIITSKMTPKEAAKIYAQMISEINRE